MWKTGLFTVVWIAQQIHTLFIERKVLRASWSVALCWFVIFGTEEWHDSYHISLFGNVVTNDFYKWHSLQTNPADVAALKSSNGYSVVFRILVSHTENDVSSTQAPTKLSGNFTTYTLWVNMCSSTKLALISPASSGCPSVQFTCD
jgi:hypothetical protein